MTAAMLPSRGQELLLSAALGGPVAGAASLADWANTVDFDDIDLGSQRILPLLYKSHNGKPDHPEAERISGLYKRAWFHNQLIRHRATENLNDFEANGIDAIVLKGLSLAVTAYRDIGARPMADADVLVRPDQFAAAYDRMLHRGWRPIAATTSRDPFYPRHHGVGLVDDEGFEFDLHYSVFNAYGHGPGDQMFWERSVPIDGYASTTKTLSPSDQLLHVIVHGLQRNAMPPIRWIPDGVLILRAAGASFDWTTFADESMRRGLVVPSRFGLAVLADYGASVPESAMVELARHHPGPFERYEFWACQQEPTSMRLASDYVRVARSLGKPASPSGLLSFVTKGRSARAMLRGCLKEGKRMARMVLGR